MEVESGDTQNNDLESEDSNDSDAVEKVAEQKIAELEKVIAENQYHYDSHVELIKRLQSVADLERLRLARQRMSKNFPLTPGLWLDWLRDEIKIANSVQEKKKLVEVFEKALKDYLSIELWLEYAEFNIGIQNEGTEENVKQIRSLFERALTVCGLHVTKGSLIWDAFIEFELYMASLLSGNIDSQQGKDAYTSQLKRIGNLFKRQLSCPLLGMEETKERFDNWLKECSDPTIIVDVNVINNIYKSSLDKLKLIEPYENNLLSSEEDKLIVYNKYIEHESSKQGTPSRVLCLYERAIGEGELCLLPNLWLDYIKFMDTVLNSPAVLDVCVRSLRNCPWAVSLHKIHIISLEKYLKPNLLVTEAVEQALLSGFQSPTDHRDVWMTYLEYLRRRYDSPDIEKEEEEKRLEDLRQGFQRALEHISNLDGADPDCEIAQYWSRVEANYCKNMEKCRSLWSDIMLSEHNNTASMWLEYLHLERTFGDSKHLRKLYPRAMTYTRDWPEVIKRAWLNYERDEGTLESYLSCVSKCDARIKQVEAARERERAKKVPAVRETQQFPAGGRKQSKKHGLGYVEEQKKPVTGYKRKSEDSLDSHVSPLKKERMEECASSKTEDIVDKLLKEKQKDDNTQHGVKIVHDSLKDNRTVFVSNLSFDTDDSVIRNIFSACGNITDIRLVRDFKGRSKGYCYVEFQTQKEAAEALKKDREKIDTRPMFVSKCDPDRQTRTSGFKFSTNLEKNKLFIRGLPFSTTEQDIRQLFCQYGSLTDARLVTYRNGHSKGLAYVEFKDEVSAAQAIIKTDGTKIGENEISVAISNPPARKGEGDDVVGSLGGGAKESGARGRSRTQVSFLPRSLQLQQNTADSLANLSIASPSSVNNGSDKKPLSNSQFREMLLNKK